MGLLNVIICIICMFHLCPNKHTECVYSILSFQVIKFYIYMFWYKYKLLKNQNTIRISFYFVGELYILVNPFSKFENLKFCKFKNRMQFHYFYCDPDSKKNLLFGLIDKTRRFKSTSIWKIIYGCIFLTISFLLPQKYVILSHSCRSS